MAIGIAVGLALTVRLARRLGFSDDTILTAAFGAIVFGFVGARVTHVIDNWADYSRDPLDILALQKGGLGWYGALIGGVVGAWIAARLRKFSLARFADATAPGIFLGLCFGRVGCTLNGDSPGTETSLPWGIVYTNPDSFAPLSVSTHPAAAYEILWNIAIVLVLWRLWKRLTPDGSLFLVSLVLYSVGRFVISWLRAEDQVLGPLHQSHLISLAIFAVAAGLLAWRKTRFAKPDPIQAAEPPVQP
jgi:phosphatidylglycerol---prolipoprotein diacylglyceryl transferase